MRIYGIGDNTGGVSFKELKMNIGEKTMVKIEHKIVNDKKIEIEAATNVMFNELVENLMQNGAYIDVFEEVDGYTLRSGDIWGKGITEYKIIEVL